MNERMTAGQQIRAHALHAAVGRHADLPTWERDANDVVLATAERFARWIEGELRPRNSPGEVPVWPPAASEPTRGYADTRETPQGHTGAES